MGMIIIYVFVGIDLGIVWGFVKLVEERFRELVEFNNILKNFMFINEDIEEIVKDIGVRRRVFFLRERDRKSVV